MKKKFALSWLKIIEYLFYIFVFSLPWQTKLILRPSATSFNEISLYVSQVILLFVLVAFFAYKFRQRSVTEKISALWISLAGLEICVLASFFWAPDQILAFYHYILWLAAIGLFYLLREGIAASEYDEGMLNKTKVIFVFLSSLFFQAGLAVYQFLTQSTPVNKYLGLAAHQADVAGTSVIEAASGRWLRAYGGMDHPNVFGGVLVIALIITAYLLARKKILSSRLEIAESIFLFVFYFIALFALFFTFSRAAWLAFSLSSLLLFIYFLIQKDRWIIGRFLALVFFSLVMLFIAAAPYRDLCQARISGESRLEKKSIEDRRLYLSESTDVIKKNWLLGVGIGNYPSALEQGGAEKKAIWDYQPVHNVFLLLWSESGILALIFFVSFLILLIKKDRRTAFAGIFLTALIILMLFDHWLISLPFGIIFLFLVLGLV